MSRKEIDSIAEQLKETFEGDPWFGRNLKAILSDADPMTLFETPNGQHSLYQLLLHTVNWRQFVISRLIHDDEAVKQFEENDWDEKRTANEHEWQLALEKLFQTQFVILEALEKADDDLLDKNVKDREYNYRKLLNGIVQHDIYHLGQMAYLIKYLKAY